MQSALERLLVIDGGVSTTLAETHPDIHADKLWSSGLIVKDPSSIVNIHTRFLEAGADIIGSVTYQASVEGFIRSIQCSQDEAKGLITLGAQLAVQARDEFWKANKGNCRQQTAPQVAGCMGPYGALLCDGSEYNGSYLDCTSMQVIEDSYRSRLAGLLQGGVDLLAFETTTSPMEAEIICKIMADFPDITAWISFSCKDSKHVSHGETFADAVEVIRKTPNVPLVGINCTAAHLITPLLKSLPVDVFKEKTVLVYPNLGKIWDSRNRCFADTVHSVKGFSKVLVEEWLSCGVKWFGGCCRTSPSDIADIVSILDPYCSMGSRFKY